MRPRLILPIALAILSLVVAALIATAEVRAPLDRLDPYARQAAEDWKVPGLAVVVVKDGRVAFEKGYGVRELGKPELVDEHTLFAIGSTTKAMTAAAVGMLVDEGKLKWDDRVITHLRRFELYDPVMTREVTLRDLLTHRAGLGTADFLWYGQETSTKEILRRLRFLRPETSMRSHFTYQNIMYAAAGEVVAEASGMRWEQFIRARILQPLGMTDTVMKLVDLPRGNVASPHDLVEGAVRVIENASVDPVAPAGSIWSSVDDMSRWLRALLNDCRPEASGAKPLLSASSCAELFKPQVIVGPDGFYPTATLTEPHWTTYGLGWFQEDYAGHAVDFHTGSIDGMAAIAGVIRAERLGVYVLANLDHAEVRHALMYRVFDLYRGREARDWSHDFLKLYADERREREKARGAAEGERVSNTRPSLPLERYAGAYSDPLYGTLRVSYEGKLRIAYGNRYVGSLEHWNYDTFRATWDRPWLGMAYVLFRLNRRGVATTVELQGATFGRRDEKDVPSTSSR
ncbi:MAG: serine hydrolase [Acidobacteria bacterium]|nr:serine hydrolase [Acidobacteriota bacterium]